MGEPTQLYLLPRLIPSGDDSLPQSVFHSSGGGHKTESTDSHHQCFGIMIWGGRRWFRRGGGESETSLLFMKAVPLLTSLEVRRERERDSSDFLPCCSRSPLPCAFSRSQGGGGVPVPSRK